eukprot:jgi/Botrbrau1/11986/Bobra.0115s0022.1
MNDRQRHIFNGVHAQACTIGFLSQRAHIRSTFDAATTGDAPPPLRWFVTGGAGTGKSYVINLLRELIIRSYAANDAVLLAAPTGVASFNIGATSTYTELSGEKVLELRMLWKKVKFLIIDKISMVGSTTHLNVSRRLVQILCKSSTFGGINIIVVGDFYQLPPVKSWWIFSGALWRREFHMKQLLQNQWQRGDDSWATTLNDIRYGRDSPALQAAYELLQTRYSNCIGGPVPHDEHNSNRLQALIQQGVPHVTLLAGHTHVDSNGVAHRDANIWQSVYAKIPKETDNCGGLSATIKNALLLTAPHMSGIDTVALCIPHRCGHDMLLCIGARVMLKRNLHTEDGLVTGVCGTVVDFLWPSHQSAGTDIQPSEILVHFDNPRVGAMLRETRVTSVFRTSDGWHQMERHQFHLQLAWAMTIHCVQGLGMDRGVIDLGSTIFAHGQAYVALSRVRTLQGVLLIGLCKKSLLRADRKVSREYECMTAAST